VAIRLGNGPKRPATGPTRTEPAGSLGQYRLMTAELTVRLVGGPTAVIELGGVRLLTDPTLDPPGDYPIGERVLTKTTGPAVGADQLGRIDAVLLSHDQHPDNLDRSGRALLPGVPLVLSTELAAQRLGGATRALPSWQRTAVGEVTVTAVPAQHGPDGTTHLTGPVTGFVLSGDGLPTVYVSGDNASLDVVRAVAERTGPVDVAVLFAGAARTALIDGYLTLTADDAAEAARILGVRTVVPVHAEGWTHFSQGVDDLLAAYAAAGLSDRLRVLSPGETATV
jgi:L-ascorbate metabolism protein UlaG (beta-lactamase superfamily)